MAEVHPTITAEGEGLREDVLARAFVVRARTSPDSVSGQARATVNCIRSSAAMRYGGEGCYLGAMPAVILYAEFTAKAGQEDAVAALISGLAADVHRESGNEQFTVYRERDEPRRFFVFERYVDEDAFQTHINAPYGAVFNVALGDLIEEDGSVLTFLSEPIAS